MTFIIYGSLLENCKPLRKVFVPSPQYRAIPISHNSFLDIFFISFMALSIITCLRLFVFVILEILLFSIVSFLIPLLESSFLCFLLNLIFLTQRLIKLSKKHKNEL